MIFILGIERSGTTWVANLLDHHPRIEMYMEPLSRLNSRFKKWPHRFTSLGKPDEMAAYFRQEFETLKNHRHFLLTRFSDTAAAWRTDLNWAQFLIKKNCAPAFVHNFHELNFHRKHIETTVSKQPPTVTAIKELRLNFNADLINAINRQAKILIVIRDLASTVRSILHQVDGDGLAELSDDLVSRYGEITPQTVAKYWLESYRTLFECLETGNIAYHTISHTGLLQSPEQTVNDFLEFLNLEAVPEIQVYLQRSNRAGQGKHSTRRSRTELLQKIQDDRGQVYPHIKPLLDEVRNHPVLANFVD